MNPVTAKSIEVISIFPTPALLPTHSVTGSPALPHPNTRFLSPAPPPKYARYRPYPSPTLCEQPAWDRSRTASHLVPRHLPALPALSRPAGQELTGTGTLSHRVSLRTGRGFHQTLHACSQHKKVQRAGESQRQSWEDKP